MFLVPVSRSSTEFSRSLERLFDESFFDRRQGGLAAESAPGSRSPAIDVIESERAYTVLLDLPGVAKTDVKIAIEGRRVSIEAAARQEELPAGERVLCRERSTGRWMRQFTLPQEIDQAESQARLDNGVLTLTLSKRRSANTQHLTVN